MTSPASGGLSRRGSHRLSLVAVCPRKWHFRFQRGIEPKRPPPYLLEGTLVHLALAYYWASKMLVKPKWYEEETLSAAMSRVGKGHPQAIDLALKIRDAYQAKYEEFDFSRFVPVAVEYEFEATLGELFQGAPRASRSAAFTPDVQPSLQAEVVTSRIDLLVRSSAGGLWALDYKTVGRVVNNSHRLPTWNPAGEYALSWQFLLQYSILKARLGDEFRGIIIERVSKVWPFDFDRQVSPVALGPLTELPRIVQRLVERERELENDAFAARLKSDVAWMPDGHPWSCFPWGRACEYRDLCLVSDSPSAFEGVVLGGYQQAQ